MARSMRYRATSRYPADAIYAAISDRTYLIARLEQLGGPGARLLEHEADDGGVRYTLQHGMPQGGLSPLVAGLLPGEVLIERSETLHPAAAGGYAGDVAVQVKGVPAVAGGWMRLQDVPSGNELVVHADIAVPVPLLGDRIEKMVAEQIRQLLEAETRFTLDWLARPR